MVTDLLNQLPNMFENNRETGSALGAALQASYKLVVSNRETGSALGAALQASYKLVVSFLNSMKIIPVPNVLLVTAGLQIYVI
jgi:uncharacterized membrane protein (UPF0136 family)